MPEPTEEQWERYRDRLYQEWEAERDAQPDDEEEQEEEP